MIQQQPRKVIKEQADARVPLMCGGRAVVMIRAYEDSYGLQFEITGDVNATVRVSRERNSMRYFIAPDDGTTIGKVKYD